MANFSELRHFEVRRIPLLRTRVNSYLSAERVDLTPEDLRDIEAAVSGVEVWGDRYSPQMQQRVDR